jgi:hypothetical protein
MKTLVRRILVLALFVVMAPGALAKGVTVKIAVSGGSLKSPLAITDPAVVGQFSIWTGPNSRWRGQDGVWHTDYHGAYVDFPAGAVPALPHDTLGFDVEFFVASMPDQPPIEETYRVRYAMEPDHAGGYVFLPQGNPFIHHGVEGNWFRSTEAWEDLVRPLIMEALNN